MVVLDLTALRASFLKLIRRREPLRDEVERRVRAILDATTGRASDEATWAEVRRRVEDELLVLWREGRLVGETPDKAYFCRCDRTTMTQADLDAGRLVVLVGIAEVKPAEFVIIRIVHEP